MTRSAEKKAAWGATDSHEQEFDKFVAPRRSRSNRQGSKPKKLAINRIRTGGGAVVQGSVKLSNGHFIGRDCIFFISQALGRGENAEEAQLALAHYLHALSVDLAGLKLGSIDASVDGSRQAPLQLADIYIPLNTKTVLSEHELHRRLLKLLNTDAGRADTREMIRGASRVTALEALARHPRLTLLGPPGSGKSTFGAYVLLMLVQSLQGYSQKLSKLGKDWSFGSLLPIRVQLRRFAERHAGDSKRLTPGDIWAFIGEDFHEAGWGGAQEAMVTVQRLARRHGALVFFDGLDECGDSNHCQRVLDAVREFMLKESTKFRFLLTARPYAFQGERDPQQGVFVIADFDSQQIKEFIAAWYDALVKRGWCGDAAAISKRDNLVKAVGRRDLLPLARNPLLLTLMATLHSNRGRLPDDRVDLYNETVDLLLYRWNKDVGSDRALLDALAIPGLKLSDIRSMLEALAFRVHEANVSEKGVAEIGEDELVRNLRHLLAGSKDKADEVVQFIERRAGLLLGLGERDGQNRFTFPHRTFQEFLAACHLSTRENFAGECRRLADHDSNHWRVVLTLAARLAKVERGATAADELVGGIDVQTARRAGALTDKHWQRAAIAGLQLQELGVVQLRSSSRNQAILSRVQGWLSEGLPVHPADGGLPAVDRASSGDVLAVLGDPRFSPDRFYMPADDLMGFVYIPADPDFHIGTREDDARQMSREVGIKADFDEFNDRPTPTGAFYIGRYLVTVDQFRAFLEATNATAQDRSALNEPWSRPVHSVNWHEALAYCKWLQCALATAPQFSNTPIAQRVRQQGWQIALPSELEWEKAARSTSRYSAFFWGDTPEPERANYRDTNISGTSVVGCFPPNGFGLYDMLGNVFEWTRSVWTGHKYGAAEARFKNSSATIAGRAIRGGSWVNGASAARCAYRHWSPSEVLSNGLGFRVVCIPPVASR